MRNQGIHFSCPKQLASFLAALVREGVTYEVDNLCGGWTVRLTGGF